MSTDYPVQIDALSPPHFDRVQLLLRIGLAIVLAWLGFTAGWLVFLLFAALPLIAAFAISSAGPEGYRNEIAPPIWSVLEWLLRVSAYMMLLVDRFPTEQDHSVVARIRYTGTPTVGSALARLVTSLPSGLCLMFLWWVSAVLWIVAGLTVLLGLSIPSSILAFQRGVLRWQARLVAYHASFVAEYPPWSFDTAMSSGGELAAAGQR